MVLCVWSGGNPDNYLDIAPENMDSIIKNIELTLDEREKLKIEKRRQDEMENKEAVGVKDRAAEGL